MALTNLFNPIKLGNVEIRNRTAMAPMGVGLYSSDETWPRRELRYFEERAIGGIGLLITPFTRVHDRLASVPMSAIYDDRFIDTHKELVERCHRHGAKTFCQIALSGGKISCDAPSAIYHPNFVNKPNELTTAELDELVQSFIDAAGRAVKAGYDGVEVHGAHTYLIGQLMSPSTNKRTDKYGGSFDARMKFAVDVITGIKKACPDFNIGFKFSAHEAFEDGIKIDDAKEIAKCIAELGVCYLHVASTASTVELYSEYPSVPPLYIPRNTLMPLADEIKKTVPDMPIIGTGSITVPEEAEEFIAQGQCDMVALGRTILADPHWPNKAKEGKRVRPCIRCNVCYHQLWLGGPLWCAVNPYLMHEAEQDVPPAVRKKDVMVVGAGPSGIYCALTASKRGHNVTLYEKRPYVGGMVFPGSRPECKRDVARLYEYFVAELEDSDVTLKLNTEVTPELVDQERPDALVLAVGTEPIIPDIPGIEKPHVETAVDVMRDVTSFKGKKAVVVGGGDVGCECACLLADNGWDVTIVEIAPKLMEENIMTNVKVQMFALLEKKGIKSLTETRVTAITDEGCEILQPNGKHNGLDADLVAFAVGMKKGENFELGSAMNIVPLSGKLGVMAMKADEVHMIGDCAQLGRIREATEAGERIGRWL